MTDIVFPEDEGTGGYPDSDVARASDFNDAAHFAAHVYAAQPHSALIEGGQISNYDAASNTVTVESGIAALTEDNISGDRNPVTHDSGTFVADFDARTVSLSSSSGINEIYLTIDLSNNDTVTVETVSDGSEPFRPAVKIGTVDAATDTVSEQWNLLTDDGTLSFPDKNAATTALTSLPTGVSVIDRSNATLITNGSLEANDFGDNATESVQDIVGGLITGQNDANVTYNDTNDQLSIDVSTLTNEEVQDTVASFVSSDSNLSWSYDDTNNTLTVALSDSISIKSLEATNAATTEAEVTNLKQTQIMMRRNN